jgi:hypothetical protein
MSYEYYRDFYSIEKFIKECMRMDLFDIVRYAETKCNATEKTRKDRDEEYLRHEYYHFVHKFAFLIKTGIKPGAMPDDDFFRTKPIIEKLVEKGQLDASILQIYQ